MTPGIRPLLAGNWKMNGLRSDLGTIRDIAGQGAEAAAGKADLLLCVPATLLYVATTLSEDTPLAIGAQDCHPVPNGAHTGDIAAEMIADCYATHCIVGHSERRTAHGESSEAVREKAGACHRAGLVAIVCVGETDEENREGRTRDVVVDQIVRSLPPGATASNTVIAYEPVWAIGTGRTPSEAEVQRIHGQIREVLDGRSDRAAMERARILYGGSVKPANAPALMSIPNVDGALVGGASLDAADFLGIASAYRGLSEDFDK